MPDSYGIGNWPMADDEVPSLVEMGLYDVAANAFSVPAAPVERLPKALPVWYAFQRTALRSSPAVTSRLPHPSLICAHPDVRILVRHRGAMAGAVVCRGVRASFMNLSQPFVYLAQIDRFYSMPLLLMTATLMHVRVRPRASSMLLVTAVLATLTVLSHNVTVAVFVLSFIAACCAYLVGAHRCIWSPASGSLAAAISVLTRTSCSSDRWFAVGTAPAIRRRSWCRLSRNLAFQRWPSRGSGWRSWCGAKPPRPMVWWRVVLLRQPVSAAVHGDDLEPALLPVFPSPVWVLARTPLESRGAPAHPPLAAAWYWLHRALLLPNLASHYMDGSRHDYRAAANVVIRTIRRIEPILSDDAETISYYLPENLRRHLFVRTKATTVPASSSFWWRDPTHGPPCRRFKERQLQLLPRSTSAASISSHISSASTASRRVRPLPPALTIARANILRP